MLKLHQIDAPSEKVDFTYSHLHGLRGVLNRATRRKLYHKARRNGGKVHVSAFPLWYWTLGFAQ